MGAEAFRFYGRSVANLPPDDERAAIGTVTITTIDANGPYVIPEGLEVSGRGALGEPVGFRTLQAAVVPNASTTATGIPVEALEPGAAGNSVSGPGEFVEYRDYLATVEFDAPTLNGRDAEGDEPYLDRLATEMQLSSPTPILPNEFAVMARRLGAHRATAIDGLNPATGTVNNERMVALAMIDETGEPEASAAAIGAQLDAMREVSFAVPTFAPAYTTIKVAYTAVAYPGWDPAVVEAAADAQVASYLSPWSWGQREDTGEEREWLNEPVVRYLEVAEQLQRVEGLRYITALQIAKQADALGVADVVMTGFAPLPRPGTITGTVNPG
jgi:hypothetical protein